jgi:nucleotide-binding universal stress UspA family protein
MPGIAPIADVGIKSVLIATDFSKASQKPLRHALTIARHYGAKFYLTHVVSSIGYTIAGPQAAQLAFEAAGRDMRQLERDLVESNNLATLNHEFIVRQGPIWHELQSVIAEKKVDLVVVGTHGRQSAGKLLLGSVAEQIFRSAECLVITVGPGSPHDAPLSDVGTMKVFLFATDFGGASLRALPRAISFANHFGVKLVLLHVAPIAPIPEGFHWSSTTTDVTQLQERARREAVQRLEEMMSHHPTPNVPPELMVKFGVPSKTILRAAEHLRADLIVMGLHRARYISTATHMPWDTSYSVVCGAACPVLTVRSDD